jgi:hypothetical protein
MSDEQINIAIAEALGHKDIALRVIAEGTGMDSEVLCSGTLGRGGYAIPDYCNDLNAMREAEKTLGNDFRFSVVLYHQLIPLEDQYEDHTITWSIANRLIKATARQRAQAFLRAIGKWEEEK